VADFQRLAERVAAFVGGLTGDEQQAVDAE